MAPRLGLHARMTVSYVLATVAIVLFVEALAGAFVLPRLTGGSEVTVKTLDSAETLAKKVALLSTSTGALPPSGGELAAALPTPSYSKPLPSGRIEPIALILDTRGRIVATSYPIGYPGGADAARLLPADAAVQIRIGFPTTNPKLGAAAVAVVPGGKAVWALVAIRVQIPPDATGVDTQVDPKSQTRLGTIGYTYVQIPAQKQFLLVHKLSSGAFVLILTIPVGVVFGLLTTRGLRRRLRRLAEASQAVAGGNFDTRVTPVSSDEVGQLERNFNDMTARLGEATARELELASQNARLAERSRISRELHDSISQDLFSLALLSGGLERALPSGSPLQAQVQRISETVATAIHEMRALVLDLHPSALAEKGLGSALEDLCASYRARLGLDVTCHVEPGELQPAVQHAILRVAQEALANATRHADANRIALELKAVAGGSELVVTDDGRGFDPAALIAPFGVGLRLMHERVAEIGGALTVESQPGSGTTVRALLSSFPPALLEVGPAQSSTGGAQ